MLMVRLVTGASFKRIKLGPVQFIGLPQKNQSRQSSDSPEMIASFTIASEFVSLQ